MELGRIPFSLECKQRPTMTNLKGRLRRREFIRLAAGGAAALALPDAARTAEPVDMKNYTYKKVGGIEIKADVYNAPATGRRPAVIWIHGGALIVGHRGALMNRFHDKLIAQDWT